MRAVSDFVVICTFVGLGLLALAPVEAHALAHGEVSGSGIIGEPSVDLDSLSVGVDEGSGAATLSIPVDLPPGPNGQRPSLALAYSTHQGNGLLGVGWRLGFPRIACSARFGVPNHATCERFELDGQVLVGPDPEGNYHTFEESFSRIRPAGGVGAASGWSVTSTEGQVSHFGADAGSRVFGSTGIAEWHVSRIEDVFGNQILFEYSQGPVQDTGELRPSRITYAQGHREVLFLYESRPDPSISYRGGLRRALSERLREIQVLVNDQLHHRLILRYESAKTTTQSRLISVQRFGSDCDPSTHADPTPNNCSSLPPAEFAYTDSGDLSAAERWVDTGEPTSLTGGLPLVTPAWYAPPEARFSTGDGFLRGQSTQFADLNGDGFPDVVTDQIGRHDAENFIDPSIGKYAPAASAGPKIHLSNGVDGWEAPTWNGGERDPDFSAPTNVPDNDSALWTDRLRSIRFDLPALRVKQVYSFDPRDRPSFVFPGSGSGNKAIALGSCVDAGEPLPAVEVLADAGSIQSGGRDLGMVAPYFDASGFRNAEPGYPWSPTPSYEVPAESEIRVWPHFQFVDLNADGLADLVMSIHLSGFYLSMDSCSSARVQGVDQATWIPGADARIVVLNSGDITGQAETFRVDDGRSAGDGDYADSLPLFGIVAFESSDLAYEEIGKGELRPDNSGQIASPCDDYGLAGLRDLSIKSWDFCIAPIDLTPVFQDLNGDGYPDLIVKRPFDPTKPGNPDYADGLFYNYDPGYGDLTNFEPVHRVGALESVAWLQNPNPAPGEARWFRAPAYDPPIDHSFVAQFPGDSPDGGQAPAYFGSRGNAQVFNIDNGVRFADLNRDGLSDMLVSPRILSRDTPFPQGAALINRGTPAPLSAPRFSAWCVSKALTGVDLCAEADRFTPPRAFVDGYAVYGAGWGTSLGSVTVIPRQTLVSLADYNGDGWVDMLLGSDPDDPAAGAVYLHNPGAAGSVWVKDERFTPLETHLYMDNPGGSYDGNAVALPTGYGFADVNGDGVADIVGSDRAFFPFKHSWISTPESARSDLLAEYKNGQGLVVDLAYTGALEQRDASLEARAWAHSVAPIGDGILENDGLAEPPGPDPTWPSVDDVVRWTPGPVLASKTVSMPNRAATTTTYRYAHPRRCPQHRTDHGYRLVEAQRGDGSRTETFYFQKHGRAGKRAEQTVYDEFGNPLRHRSEVWALPLPWEVNGGWADSTSSDVFDVAYVGRLASETSRNEYGAVVGESPGFTSTTRFEYDDVHGYNFVAETIRDLPGRRSRTVTTPEPVDLANHLTNRTRQVQTFADQGGDRRLLSEVRLSYRGPDNEYTYNKVGRRRVLDAKRDDPEGSRWNRTAFKYAGNGNLIEEREYIEDSAGSESRSTTYCYDGDSGCAAGQLSGSLLVGTRDATGRWASSEPHPVFASAVRSQSDYQDVPNLRFELDPLGRRIEEWFEPASGDAPLRLSHTRFADYPTPQAGLGQALPPYRVETKFAEAEASSAVESIRVSDGAGGVSLTIDLLDSVSTRPASVASVAVERDQDPNARTARTTEPFACGEVAVSGPADHAAVVAACSSVSEAEKTFTLSRLDALGRPVEVVTPRGVEHFRYQATELVVIGSGRHTPHDLVLQRDANGGVREVVLADGKPVRIRECNHPAPVASLEGASCLDPDETRIGYEPTGEIRERIDPTLASNGVYQSYSVGAFDNQRLRYLRDTLGRVIQIDDPDAGTSHQAYDAFGNLISSVDARGIEVKREYDALDRLTRIEVEGGIPTEIGYAANGRKRRRVVDGALRKLYAYDELGRTTRETRWIDGRMLKVEVRRDFLGRPTQIQYPTVLDGAIDTIAYDYDGIRLTRVCDVGAVGQAVGDCDAQTATPIATGVHYDDLGRVAEVVLPGGTRRFGYDGASLRRTLDAFESNASSEEDVEFSYRMPGAGAVPAYDALGNLLHVAARVADQSYEMGYAYDARNRIAAWHWRPNGSGAGTDYPFAYDTRGNMILHGGDAQDFTAFETAHAIRSRISGGVTTSYSYDAAGNLSSKSTSTGETTHYRFDGRGRLTCIGTNAGACNRLIVSYNGEGERVREVSTQTFLHAGPDFRVRPYGPGGQEYWIEIYAFGERIAYKHVAGGALRLAGLLPGWEPSRAEQVRLRQSAYAGLLAVGLLLLVWVSTGPSPLQGGVALGLVLLASVLPVQARAGSLRTNPTVGGSAVYRWVLSDMIGSGLVEIDAAGEVLAVTAYRPFGQVASEFGSGGVGGRAFFAGHDRELINDLVYMNARWMDPRSGTFMSVDPLVPNLRDPQSYNGFSYARNNPVSLVDPMGTDWRIVWKDPKTGKTTSKGPWNSGSGARAAAFVDGVRTGTITPATITSALADAGGSQAYGVAPSVAAGPPANAGGAETPTGDAAPPPLSENEQHTVDYFNREIAGHEAAIADLKARNQALGAELSQIDSALDDLAHEITDMADSARSVRSFQQLDVLNNRIALKGLKALGLSLRREGVQGRFDSNASFIRGHQIQLGYLRRDRADFMEVIR